MIGAEKVWICQPQPQDSLALLLTGLLLKAHLHIPKQPRRKQNRKKEKKHHLLESLLPAGWGALGTQRAVQCLEAQGVDRDVGKLLRGHLDLEGPSRRDSVEGWAAPPTRRLRRGILPWLWGKALTFRLQELQTDLKATEERKGSAGSPIHPMVSPAECLLTFCRRGRLGARRRA